MNMPFFASDLGNCSWCEKQLELGVFKIYEDDEEEFCSERCARAFHYETNQPPLIYNDRKIVERENSDSSESEKEAR